MRERGFLLSTIVVVSLLFASNAGATPITIVNPGFELPSMADGGFNVNIITGWTVSGSSGVFNPTVAQLPPPTEGVQTAYINLGNITQVLAATLLPDTVYTLSADFLARTDCCVWPGSELDLIAGGTVVASAFIAPGALAPGGIQASTVSFLAAAGNPLLGQQLQVRVANTNGAVQLNVDNVQLDAASRNSNVPEPASLLLVGSAVGAWMARRRMRG